MLHEVLHALLPFFSAYFFIGNTFYLVVIACGIINLVRIMNRRESSLIPKLARLRAIEPVTVIVPCYNERFNIIDSVKSMLALNYPNLEIIVVNDGSKDDTMDVLREGFGLVASQEPTVQVLPCKDLRAIYRSPLHTNLLVADKDNGGKSDALNAGINLSTHDLVCCVDADSYLEAEGLMRVAMPFIIDPAGIVATGGSIMVASDRLELVGGRTRQSLIPWSFLAIVQSIEYLRAFLIGRLGWNFLKADTLISGAFGLFRKDVVIKAGGYAHKTIGEDMELFLRIIEHARRNGQHIEVRMLPDPVCWTEAPSDFRTLGNQRSRWTQGLAESLWRRRYMMFRWWAGPTGMIGLPYQLFYELLSPIVELMAYVVVALELGLGSLVSSQLLILSLASIVYGCFLNLLVIYIDLFSMRKYSSASDIFKLSLGAVCEQFFLRFVNTYYRLRGLYRWTRGNHSWGNMQRAGAKTR